MSLQPHQQRVVEEQAELNERLDKLSAFFRTPIFKALDPVDQFLLERQSEIMQKLNSLLHTRIQRFKAAA